MSFETWHNYGYGICVSDIKEHSVERLQRLLHQAPRYEAEIKEWLVECEIDTPTYEDYMEFDQDYNLGIATILREVIQEAENIGFLACDDFCSMDYLIYPPSYPWGLPKNEAGLTKDKIADILHKYIGILTDEDITIDYQSVENGG